MLSNSNTGLMNNAVETDTSDSNFVFRHCSHKIKTTPIESNKEEERIISGNILKVRRMLYAVTLPGNSRPLFRQIIYLAHTRLALYCIPT